VEWQGARSMGELVNWSCQWTQSVPVPVLRDWH